MAINTNNNTFYILMNLNKGYNIEHAAKLSQNINVDNITNTLKNLKEEKQISIIHVFPNIYNQDTLYNLLKLFVFDNNLSEYDIYIYDNNNNKLFTMDDFSFHMYKNDNNNCLDYNCISLYSFGVLCSLLDDNSLADPKIQQHIKRVKKSLNLNEKELDECFKRGLKNKPLIQ